MLFFQKRNKEAEKIAREHQRPAWVRLPLMLFFFIILGALFSYHFERRLEQLEAESSFWDETDGVSDTARSRLNEHIRRFRGAWGMPVIAHIRKDIVLLPEKIEANTLFIGVSPSRGDAVILLPPLVSRALKNDGTHDARRVMEHELGLCARASNPVSCLEQTLDALDSMLR